MLDELLLVCTFVGTRKVNDDESDVESFVRGEDCVAWLQDLQRALRGTTAIAWRSAPL